MTAPEALRDGREAGKDAVNTHVQAWSCGRDFNKDVDKPRHIPEPGTDGE